MVFSFYAQADLGIQYNGNNVRLCRRLEKPGNGELGCPLPVIARDCSPLTKARPSLIPIGKYPSACGSALDLLALQELDSQPVPVTPARRWAHRADGASAVPLAALRVAPLLLVV